jgi:hypothetical protein
MLTEHIRKVLEHVTSTDDCFHKLYSGSPVTSPIPFFGNISTAEIITVGVNPAESEFRNRNWPRYPVSTDYLELRLPNYFHLVRPEPHPWFDPWEAGLRVLRQSSYRTNAAHLDLSPRATIRMSKAHSQKFRLMLEADTPWLFKSLGVCRQAKLIMMSGKVPSQVSLGDKNTREFMDSFLASQIPPGLKLVPEGEFFEQNGTVKISFHRLVGKRRTFSVFYCSVSPSANPEILTKAIGKHRSRLISGLDCPVNVHNN